MAHASMMLTLQDDPVALGRAVAALSSDACATVGVPQGTRLPLIYETGQARAAWEVAVDLRRLPGVELVDLVWVEYDATETSAPALGTAVPDELEVASFEFPLGALPS